MCYLSNSEFMIKNADSIKIDTCSLMKMVSFIPFLESSKEYLRKYNKRIVILGTVHDELKDKSRSEYFDLKDSACKALDYIYKNLEYFDIRDNYTDENFADPEIQRTMLDERRNTTQLLISNDGNLTKFIYDFNKNKAVFGYHIYVCYLDQNGNLRKCDCVKEKQEEVCEVVNAEPEVKVVEKVKTIEKTVYKTIVEKPSLFEKITDAFGWFTFGVATTYYGPKVVNFLRKQLIA